MCDRCRDQLRKAAIGDVIHDLGIFICAALATDPKIIWVVKLIEETFGLEMASEVLVQALKVTLKSVEDVRVLVGKNGERTSPDTKKVDDALQAILAKVTGEEKGQEREK